MDSPGIRRNQVYGMISDTRTPFQAWAGGTYMCLPTYTVGPSASAAPPSHSGASSQALRRRRLAIRPATASPLSTTPNVFSVSRCVCEV